jgi:predicted N-acyltransferase
LTATDYVTRVLNSPLAISAEAWDALLAHSPTRSPFMRHAYLTALHQSASACAQTGWQAQFITLWQGTTLVAACPLYLKNHSHGEYVFDWAWARAYAEHGLDYYPKALVAVPFTPVPGPRLLAIDAPARAALVQALLLHMRQEDLSSLHLLFVSDQDAEACRDAGMALRTTVQFHWHNRLPKPYADFDDFLNQLQQEKRKKIRQERRKVVEAGVGFRHLSGADIGAEDWAFFLRCYQQTYFEHGNAPYLTPAFFEAMRTEMSEHWLLIVAEREGRDIAASLIGLDRPAGVAYGRYWGALERVDCLHFEACYYQAIEWCIEQGFGRFEGGAQGEHKLARALLPVTTTSAHALSHPAFEDAVRRYLEREGDGLSAYVQDLQQRSPLKTPLA